ncbi:MAG: RNA polymerase sigma factor SigM [Mycobacteriaceae bacterium]|nr:RNA polymerase sigma factor SigM [Mycobacteriaceae bacterium]
MLYSQLSISLLRCNIRSAPPAGALEHTNGGQLAPEADEAAAAQAAASRLRPLAAAPTAGSAAATAEPTDAQLLSGHVGGDRHAFATLVRRHYDHLWHLARRTCYNPEDAADALQEALLSAHRNAHRFRGDSAVRTWLHTIVVNACLDRIRRNKVRQTYSLDSAPAGADSDDAGYREPADPSDPIGSFEMSHVVERALATLPPDQRAALVAVDVEGYPVAEVATMLGVAEGTVKSRCARARVKLAERLDFLRDPRNRN